MSDDLYRWELLPDGVEREAAPVLLNGGGWYHDGRPLEHPGDEELRRWCSPETPMPGGPMTPARPFSNRDKARRGARSIATLARAFQP